MTHISQGVSVTFLGSPSMSIEDLTYRKYGGKERQAVGSTGTRGKFLTCQTSLLAFPPISGFTSKSGN